jgi:hypothetical protein
MNVEIGTEAPLFLFWEYLFQIFGILSLQCAYENLKKSSFYTANKGPVKILYKCLVPIYVFLEMKLLFPKQNYNVLSPSSYTHKSVRYLYISRIGLPILLQGNMWTNLGNT